MTATTTDDDTGSLQESGLDCSKVTEELVACAKSWNATGFGFCPEPLHRHAQSACDDIERQQGSGRFHARTITASKGNNPRSSNPKKRLLFLKNQVFIHFFLHIAKTIQNDPKLPPRVVITTVPRLESG